MKNRECFVLFIGRNSFMHTYEGSSSVHIQLRKLVEIVSNEVISLHAHAVDVFGLNQSSEKLQRSDDF